MRGREEPPLSEGGSHWRVAEKGMRSITLGVSGIVGGTAEIRNKTSCVIALFTLLAGSIAHHLQTGSE